MKKITSLLLITLITLFSCAQRENSKEDSKVLREQTFEERMEEFRQLAYTDIESDDVKILGFGLPLPPKTELEAKRNKKIDSLRKLYGIRVKNLGCDVSDQNTAVANEYNKITEDYLNKRNGIGWKAKMKLEIEKLPALK